jgi:hypothetical protein
MRRILAGVVIVGLALSLEACPKPAENNTSENVSINETVDMNATDMNATDMNATDINATDMNATDMNAAGNAAAPKKGNQGSTDH